MDPCGSLVGRVIHALPFFKNELGCGSLPQNSFVPIAINSCKFSTVEYCSIFNTGMQYCVSHEEIEDWQTITLFLGFFPVPQSPDCRSPWARDLLQAGLKDTDAFVQKQCVHLLRRILDQAAPKAQAQDTGDAREQSFLVSAWHRFPCAPPPSVSNAGVHSGFNLAPPPPIYTPPQ